MNDKMIVFDNRKIRRVWFNDDWHFSIVDVVNALIDSKNPRDYVKKMRKRDLELRKGWGQIVTPLLIKTKGGKQSILCSNKKGIFRIIQSIPSKKAEPFKLWLAQVGSERIDEIDDPELSIDRVMKIYLSKGYSEKWINQRLKTIEVRKELTDEWKRSGVSSDQEFAILINEMTLAWSGKSIRDYKDLKCLKKENLRDNMTNLELALNTLAEATTTEISKEESPKGFNESENVSVRGAGVARVARKKVEKELGRSVISPQNARDLIELDKEEVINYGK
jgi:hypothetical protein